ncbi:Basic-leucine zipper [Gracilaria domingensis]|nr:Basic-leucine zipper [Gracilaria domingensis]
MASPQRTPLLSPSPPKLSPEISLLASPKTSPLAPHSSPQPLHGSPPTFPFFEPGHLEVADHFLVPPAVPISEPLMEQPMLPADPSTLPAGIETCLHGMDFEDDWCSYIASDQDSRSVSSTLSNAGSDVAPLPDSVPCVEDVIEMIDPENDLPSPPNPPKRKQCLQPQIAKKPRPLAASQPTLKPKPLAPRPAGMSVTDGFIWQIGAFAGNEAVLAARLEAMEKARKAEERRKKNRQAAARSNARKKDIMDGIRAEIRQHKLREAELREKEANLRSENELLRQRVTAKQ